MFYAARFLVSFYLLIVVSRRVRRVSVEIVSPIICRCGCHKHQNNDNISITDDTWKKLNKDVYITYLRGALEEIGGIRNGRRSGFEGQLLIDAILIYTLIIIPLSFYLWMTTRRGMGKKKVRTDKIRGIAKGVKEWVIRSKHWSGKLFTDEKRSKVRRKTWEMKERSCIVRTAGI